MHEGHSEKHLRANQRKEVNIIEKCIQWDNVAIIISLADVAPKSAKYRKIIRLFELIAVQVIRGN